MKKRWFAVPFAIGIVAMMVIVSLPGPLSPTETVLAASWGGTTKEGCYISQIHFAESMGGGSDYSHDINGNDVIYTPSSQKVYTIDESFNPAVIYITIDTPGDADEYKNYVGVSVEIKDPNGNVVLASESMGGLSKLYANKVAYQKLIPSSVDWTIPGLYSITVKLYYWM